MRILVLLFLLIPFVSSAQPCAGPGRVPEAAIVVCSSTIFHQPNVPSCSGPIMPYTNCPLVQALSSNSVWYRFHCYQAGSLGFLITPASGSDDYDWHIADITGHQPQDVFTTDLLLCMNLSGIFGTTGCTPAGVGNVNCEGNTNPYNSMPALIAGHDYLLCVTNWSNSGLGYDISFTGGTAVLGNALPPAITNVTYENCNTSTLVVTFSEDILCSSLTTTDLTQSEFSITPGTHTITSIQSVCSGGSNAFTQLTITLQDPLPGGNYQLVVNNGGDGNTLQDVCLDQMALGHSFDFTAVPHPAPAVDTILYDGCAPTVLKVAFTSPVLCSTVSPTGTEFSIGPVNPGIGSIQMPCSGAIPNTDTIVLFLQNPLPYGNYYLQIDPGGDNNSISDTCGNFTAQGYQFPFTIVQTSTGPQIQSVLFDECKPFRIVVDFDRPVACNSFSVGANEFSVTPGPVPITTIVTNCGANQYTTQVTINFTGNLPAGNFTLHVNPGTDNNTLRDSCLVFMPDNSTYDFVTTAAPRPVIDSARAIDPLVTCNPTSAIVYFSKPIFNNSVTSLDEFYITGPSPVSIANFSLPGADYSDYIILNFTQPISTFGTYTIHNAWGNDGNSVIDTCYAALDTLLTISFDVLGAPTAAFTDVVHWGCVEDTIDLSHPGGNGINSWTWNFSDGTFQSGQTVSHTFPVSTTTATIELIVSNAVCSDTLQRTITLDNAINAAFSAVDTACINSGVSVTSNSTGNNLQWLWQFGDNTTSGNQSPPAHPYATDGDFNIRLIITNDHGCSDTADKVINITRMPVVDFSGLHAQYCTADVVQLNASIQGNIASYTWDTGNSNVFQNNPSISYTYYIQGDYTVSLNVKDRYCPDVREEKTTKVFFVPRFDLGNDKRLCPGLTTEIGVDAMPGVNYLWNTGATSPKIITAMQSGTYMLTADNNGCTASDNIYVEVMSNCLIKVPGAFTPNRDGLNDRLKAINADLATNFSLRVYNRFGQQVFFTNNPLEGWDGNFKGSPADTGTYVWQLSYIDPVSKKPVYEKGTSILIR